MHLQQVEVSDLVERTNKTGGGAPLARPGQPISGRPDRYRYHAEMPPKGYE